MQGKCIQVSWSLQDEHRQLLRKHQRTYEKGQWNGIQFENIEEFEKNRR